MKCANEGCKNEVRQPDGRGRPGKFCSNNCRLQAHRREKRETKIAKRGAVSETKIANTILLGDSHTLLKTLPDRYVQCCITSPPYYGLRSYLPTGHADKPLEIGLENTPEAYVSKLVDLFHEVRRVLRDDGVLWLNLGDSYAGSGKGGQPSMYSQHWQPTYGNKGLVYPGLPAKQLMGIPWRVALALQEDGWYLRSDVIWHKSNCVPESVIDRPTRSHEYVFLLSKQKRYYYDQKAIQEPSVQPGRKAGNETRLEKNRRSVWSIPTQGSALVFLTMIGLAIDYQNANQKCWPLLEKWSILIVSK